MNRKKPHVKIVILGNIDSGRTTLAGHLIYKCGVIDKRIFDQFEKEVSKMGTNSFKYAWLANRMKDERERSVTIDISSWQFEINKNYITLMDGTSNKDFIKCMVKSISLANCVLLLIAASCGEFEAGISKYSLMRRQIELAYTMGIENLIVVVNKMDRTDPPYSEDRFNEIKIEVLLLLKKMGYQPQNIVLIPISAWFGDNLIESSDNMRWFKGCTVNSGECNTLLEALDNIVLPSPPIDKPLRMTLQAIYKTNTTETMFVGCVETGILKPDMTVQFAPANLLAQIKSIQSHYETLEEALPGDKVVFTVNGIKKEALRYNVVCSDANNDPAQAASDFIAQINILHYSRKITKGHKCVIHCHMAHVACEITELLEKIDRISGETIEKNPEFVKSGDTALVKIIPLKPICVEKYTDYPSLGRFVAVDQEWLFAVGTVKHVEKKNFQS